MSVRVEVRPELLEWALERSNLLEDTWTTKFKNLDLWLSGDKHPTLKQLEEFAKSTHAPLGYLLLAEPPHEELPIPDFRTVGGGEVARPSVDLLDTIYLAQQRQDWYRDYARSYGEATLQMVGSTTISDSVARAAEKLDDLLGWTEERRASSPEWSESLRFLREAAEDAGILVMISGIVGMNTHRGLDPDEFRGFALVDEFAPLVFVNGSDTKAAQVFTLVHELAHVLLGSQGVSDLDAISLANNPTERWCNKVAAEFLVPIAELIAEFRLDRPLPEELQRLARKFSVSTLVVLIQLRDAELLDRDTVAEVYDEELTRLMSHERTPSSGGIFYNTFPVQNSRRFLTAILSNTLEGQTLYQDAFRLTGLHKKDTFDKMAKTLGAV